MLFAFSACGGKDTTTSEPETKPDSAPAESSPETPEVSGSQTKIVLWHSMGGRTGEAIDKLVEGFNTSQDAYVIEAQYQGTYDEAIQKLRSTTKGTGPDVMQLYDIGTRWMVDSGYALKMQDFIDNEGYDISDYEKNILAYYTLDGTLYSMPFNCSSPVLIYNKEAAEKAGVNPETDFATIESCLAAAEKLSTSGGMAVGGSLTNYSWVFEQLIGLQGKDLLDNGNGRKDRATKVIIDENGAGEALLTKWKDFSSKPYVDTFGKGTAESKNQFATGTVGFILDSCSIYQDISSAAGGTFSVGFAPLPKVNEGDQGGTSVGGGSLWLMDNGAAEREAGAWEFIKYVTQPEQQAEWSMNTGYFPIRTSAVDLDIYQDYITNINPELIVAIESLRNSKPESAGGVMGVFPKARVIIENEIETMINSEPVTPGETLEKIVTQINEEIEMYNKTN